MSLIESAATRLLQKRTLGVIAGYDELDPASADTPVPDYGNAFKTPLSKLRLGMPRAPFFATRFPLSRSNQSCFGESRAVMHALSQGYFEWRFTRRNLASLLNNLGPISD
jgi:hypothetical protein